MPARRAAALVGLVILAAVAVPVEAQVPDRDGSPRRVSVSRTVRQSVTPDRATVVLGAEAVMANPGEAAARLATLEREIVDTLRRIGIPQSAISVMPHGVSIVRQPGGYQSTIVQHSAQSVIRVSVDRIDRIPAVGNAALGKGTVHVNQAVFEYSSEDSVRRVLVQQAIAEARRDAEVIARAMGGRLGQVIDVTQSSGGPSFPGGTEMVVFPSNVQFMGFSGSRQTPVTVIGSVTVRWQLVEGG